MTRIHSTPKKSPPPQKRKLEEESDSDLEETKKPKTETSAERYQALKQLADNGEKFIGVNMFRDTSTGDSNSLMVIPQSAINTPEKRYIFDRWNKMKSALVEGIQTEIGRNPFDIFAWLMGYHTRAYRLIDEWEEGMPRLLLHLYEVTIDGQKINAMPPENYCLWSQYELVIDELKEPILLPFTALYNVNCDIY